jgi:hypothetical protein
MFTSSTLRSAAALVALVLAPLASSFSLTHVLRTAVATHLAFAARGLNALAQAARPTPLPAAGATVAPAARVERTRATVRFASLGPASAHRTPRPDTTGALLRFRVGRVELRLVPGTERAGLVVALLRQGLPHLPAHFSINTRRLGLPF